MVNTLTRLNGEKLIIGVVIVDVVWAEQQPVLPSNNGVAPFWFWLLFFFSGVQFLFIFFDFNSMRPQLVLQHLDFTLHLPILLLQLPVGPLELARRLLMLNDGVEIRLCAPLKVEDVLLQTLNMVSECLWPKLSRCRLELPRPYVSAGKYLGHLLVHCSLQS